MEAILYVEHLSSHVFLTEKSNFQVRAARYRQRQGEP